MTSSMTIGIRLVVLMVLFSSASLIAAGMNTDGMWSRAESLLPAPGDSTTAPLLHPKVRKGPYLQEFSIQVGAFSIQANADRLQQKLRAAGYRTDVFKNFLNGKKLFYLVWVGSYHSEEEAKPDLASLKNKFNIIGVIRPRSVVHK